MGRIANWIAVAWTAAVGAFLLYGPMYATESTSYAIGGEAATPAPHVETKGLLAVEGSSAYARVLLPVLVALVPLLMPWRAVRQIARFVAIALLTAYALAGVMSVGMFYLPAIVALAVAQMTDGKEPARRVTA